MSYGARSFFRRSAAVVNLWQRLFIRNCCVSGQSIVTQLQQIFTGVSCCSTWVLLIWRHFTTFVINIIISRKKGIQLYWSGFLVKSYFLLHLLVHLMLKEVRFVSHIFSLFRFPRSVGNSHCTFDFLVQSAYMGERLVVIIASILPFSYFSVA